MREMKDSGIPWIGEIPKEWKIKPLKYCTDIIMGQSPDSSAVSDEGNIPFLQGNREFGKKFPQATIFCDKSPKHSRVGDILLSVRAPVGAINESDQIYAIGRGLCSIQSLTLNKKYLKFVLMKSADDLGYFSYGSTFEAVTVDTLKSFRIPVPSISEQQKISDFLDRKCGEIDALAADIEKQIETLEDYKRSAITEAVTKGLNPDVKMKDSGIAWCPSIPEHWNSTNPKALFSLRNQRALEGDRQLTASQRHGIIYQDEFMMIEKQNVMTVAKDFSILKHVEPNDFVISMRSFQGGLEYSELKGSISSAYVMLIPNQDKVHAPFYKWFFKSSKYINALQSTTNLVRDGQAMRYANFVMVPLFIIPMDEQKQISDFLDDKCAEIDGIIADKKSQLEILTDYKKSLIYEYVTGKREVPRVE